MAKAAASKLYFFIPRDAARKQDRLIELQVAVRLPFLADFKCLAKAFAIIKRRSNPSRGHAVVGWLHNRAVKARKDRCMLGA